MGLQVGTVYTLTGPDGTRAVFNDKNDPDFVGFLDDDNGITGLDSPEVRESSDVLVEADGGVHGSFYYGRRPVVLQGWVPPEEPHAFVNERIDRLQRASNAMRGDAELRWTEDGSDERRLLLRRQQPVRVTDRRPKKFQIPLVSARAEIESSQEQTAVVDPGATGFVGFTEPIVEPLESVLADGGQQFIVNQGSAPAAPTLSIEGPITNPRVLNNTTGEELRLLFDLAAGETLVIDFRQRTVLLNGTASRYSAVEFPASTWWALQPGSNDVRLNALTAGSGAQVTVGWRHAWI